MYVRQNAAHLAGIQGAWDSFPLFSAIKFTSFKKQQQGKSVFTSFSGICNKPLFTESTFCIPNHIQVPLHSCQFTDFISLVVHLRHLIRQAGSGHCLRNAIAADKKNHSDNCCSYCVLFLPSTVLIQHYLTTYSQLLTMWPVLFSFKRWGRWG